MITPDPELEIGRFLARYNGGRAPDRDVDVFEIGALTSLVAMQLVLVIEKRWNFEVPTTELRRDNFKSLAAICDLIRRHAAKPAAATT